MVQTAGQGGPKPLLIFYSYDPKDDELREELEAHLSVLQNRGMISGWHRRNVRAGDDWQQEVDAQLLKAQIILLLVSVDFLASPYCAGRELMRALERHEAGEARVIPLLLRPVSYEDAPFYGLQMLPRNGVPITRWQDRDEAWVEVVKELRLIVADIAKNPFPPEQAVPVAQIWHIPYRRNPFFTGREELLTQLHTRFTQENTGNTVALTQSLAINGLGGIGKTQTALEYAYRYRHEYQTVLWVTAATEETLLTDLLKLATQLPLPKQQIQDPQQTLAAVKVWFASQERWLLILDNADDIAMACSYLPEGDVRGHVILTTRAEAGGGLAQMLPVEVMDAKEGALLLLRRAKVLSPGAGLEQIREKARADAEAIVEAVGGLPLALDQAGAYIEETGCGLVGYLELYQTRRKELLQRRSSLPATHPEPVATTWSLSFRLIEQANPAAAALLRACAFLDPDAIPEKLFLEGGQYLGEMLAPLVEDAYAFNQAIEELRKFSLIRRTAETKALSIHRLVQVVIRDALEQEEERHWAEGMIQALNAIYPNVAFETWETCRLLLPHVHVSIALIETYQLYNKEAGDLLDRAGWYLREQYLSAQAESFFLHALAIKEKTLGPNHPDTAITLNNLGLLYLAQGKYVEAEPLFQRALAIREQNSGPEHSKTARTLNNLGLFYQAQGKFELAEPLFQRALAINEQALGPEHPDTSTVLNNLGVLYRAQGKYAQAEPLFQRALTINEQALGPEHPETSTALNNLGVLYNAQGKYAQAEPLFQRSLTVKEQTLGPDHPDTAITLGNLASLYWNQGKFELAKPLFQRSLAIKEQSLGPDHPNTAITLYNLAQLFQVQKDYEQAEQFYQRVLAIDEKVYGADHAEVATDLEIYAGLLLEMGRGEEAERLMKRAEGIRRRSD